MCPIIHCSEPADRIPPGEANECLENGSDKTGQPRGIFLANNEPPNTLLWRIVSERVELKYVASLSEFRLALREGAPDIILCSWEFPSGTWKDVIAALHEIGALVPVIVISTRSQNSGAWYEVFSGGAFDALSPPFQPSVVYWVLQQALESHVARKVFSSRRKA